MDGDFELLVCPMLISELERVLARPKFRSYASLAEVRAYAALLRRLATHHADPQSIPRITPDPGDDYLVVLARSCGADYLVSGDSHLHALDDPVPPVLTPRQFLSAIRRLLP